MRDRDHLDLLIDTALETYANPAPNDHLEERMLQAVRIQIANQTAPSYLRWLSWSAALAVTACLLAYAFLSARPPAGPASLPLQAQTQENPRAINPVSAKSPAQQSNTQRQTGTGNIMHPRIRPPVPVENAKAVPLPKQDIFPAPAPLDEQVEALAFFIRKAPPSEVKQLLENHAQADAPLALKELEIPPLQPLDEGGK